jgi:hypothetical protein
VEDSFREVYITLSSVIQGVALGYLGQTVGQSYATYTAQHWLRAVTCFGVIVAAWQEYMIGSTVYAWIPKLPDAIIPFALGAAELGMTATIQASERTFLMICAILWTTGSISWLNYYRQTARGFPSNRDSAHLFRMHRKVGVWGGLMSAAIAWSLWALDGSGDPSVVEGFVLLGLVNVPTIGHGVTMVLHWDRVLGAPRTGAPRPPATRVLRPRKTIPIVRGRRSRTML